MRLHLHNQNKTTTFFLKESLKKLLYFLMPLILFFCSSQLHAQGTWTALKKQPPDLNGGVMLVLSDGSVMAKTFSGGSDGIGNIWDKLTPNKNGSYAKGKWATTIAAMNKTRLYFSSQVLKDGRVYVAGGEYGTGGSAGETYDPLTNTWTNTPNPGATVSDANSEILPDGTVLQALVSGTLKKNLIFDPSSNTYSNTASCIGIHNECAWVKLKDNSVLMIDRDTKKSERYIPTSATWVTDGSVPVSLYDPFGLETGGAVLLPDGRAFFLGSTGHTAYYTPSGSVSPGSWAAGPDIPGGKGCPDAAAAMMVNGKILCAVSPAPTSGNHFPTPTSFYEFDYLTNSFTQVNAPGGGLTLNVSCYETNLVDLPNGDVLFGLQGSSQYYVYTPDGSPVASGKPKISTVTGTLPGSYIITGKLFNGISEGATYGDDWQMNTNYPIVRLTQGSLVYYARSYNWNSTGVMRGNLRDTAQFDLPAGLAAGTYSLVVTANGISSDPVTLSFTPGVIAQVKSPAGELSVIKRNDINIYPNPARNAATIGFTLDKTSQVNFKVFDVSGKQLKEVFNGVLQQGSHSIRVNVKEFAAGSYVLKMTTESGTKNLKLIVQ